MPPSRPPPILRKLPDAGWHGSPGWNDARRETMQGMDIESGTDSTGWSLTPARLRHERFLTLTRHVDASPREVWEWMVDPARLDEWSTEGVRAQVTDLVSGLRIGADCGAESVNWQIAPDGAGTQLHVIHELADVNNAASRAAQHHLSLCQLDSGAAPPNTDLVQQYAVMLVEAPR